MPWTQRWIAAVLVIVCVSHRGSGSSACPENVLSTASNCFPSHFSSGLVSNLTAIQEHCQNGMFKKSLSCLTQVEASCHGDKGTLLLLHSFMDINRWKASLDELCSNVHILHGGSTCWATTSQRSAQCIQNEMLELQQRLMKKAPASRAGRSSSSSSLSSSSSSSSSSSYSLSASSVSDSSETVEEALNNLKHYCNTSKGILDCFQPLLHELCAKEVSRLLEGMYLAFQPPLCDDKVKSTDDVTEEPELGGRASDKPSSAILYMSCAILSVAALRFGVF